MKTPVNAVRVTAVALSCAAAVPLFGHATSAQLGAQQVIHADLQYRAPREGVVNKPNFSPKGTPVKLIDAAADAELPQGAVRPAKVGTIEIGTDRSGWMRVLATASAEHPNDLSQLYLDRNRNGNFLDDGPPITGVPAQNAKTKAWWSSINKIELMVPYGRSRAQQPYLVNFWMVRDDSAPAPDVLRYSVGSWRYGTASINGVDAVIAAMDDDNNAVFDKSDMWSVLGAEEPNALKNVLSINEARTTNRLMFVPKPGGGEIVLQFKAFSPDGSGVDFTVLDAPMTKAADRLPDDMLRDERGRPRAAVPVTWLHGSTGLNTALANAAKSGKKVLIDFEATWCGPCHTMDEWIWSDADVASALNAGFIGVKVDVDLEKGLVSRFRTTGYPTMVLLDSSGKEIRRFAEYMGSAAMLAWLK